MMETKVTLETIEKRMDELAFLLKNLNQSNFTNDEQLQAWDEELQELQNFLGNVDLSYVYVPDIFEQKSYKLYSLEVLGSDILIVFDDCTIQKSRIIYLTEKENKQLLELCEKYDEYWYNDEYEKMDDLRYFIEREFLGLSR